MRRQKNKPDPMRVGRQTAAYNDFFTPDAVAVAMAEHLRPALRKRAGQVVRILEPSAGTGNLIWPLIQVAQEEGCILDITVIDLQDDYLDYIAEKARSLGFEVRDARANENKQTRSIRVQPNGHPRLFELE